MRQQLEGGGTGVLVFSWEMEENGRYWERCSGEGDRWCSARRVQCPCEGGTRREVCTAAWPEAWPRQAWVSWGSEPGVFLACPASCMQAGAGRRAWPQSVGEADEDGCQGGPVDRLGLSVMGGGA